MKNNNTSIFKIIMGIILLIIIILGALTLFLKPNEAPKPKIIETTDTATMKPSKPVFRKDGTLNFIDANTNKIISTIEIEVADDDHKREQGLMYRDSMPENRGMLFLMGEEHIQSFWMKNTIISLDIIYINAEHKIVSIHTDTKPYSLDNITSTKPASFVVEVNAGYVKKYGLKIGDMIAF